MYITRRRSESLRRPACQMAWCRNSTDPAGHCRRTCPDHVLIAPDVHVAHPPEVGAGHHERAPGVGADGLGEVHHLHVEGVDPLVDHRVGVQQLSLTLTRRPDVHVVVIGHRVRADEALDRAGDVRQSHHVAERRARRVHVRERRAVGKGCDTAVELSERPLVELVGHDGVEAGHAGRDELGHGERGEQVDSVGRRHGPDRRSSSGERDGPDVRPTMPRAPRRRRRRAPCRRCAARPPCRAWLPFRRRWFRPRRRRRRGRHRSRRPAPGTPTTR